VVLWDAVGTRFNLRPHQSKLGEVLLTSSKLDAKAKRPKNRSAIATGKEVWARLANETWDRSGHLGLPTNGLSEIPKLMSIHYHFWSIPKTERIHTTYNQFVAATAAFPPPTQTLQKYSQPNGQGERDQKSSLCLGMKNHILLAADYLQIGACASMAGKFSGDESMLEAFRTRPGYFTQLPLRQDLPSATPKTKLLTCEEKAKKQLNFLESFYGHFSFGLSAATDIPRGEAKEIIDAYFKEFPCGSKNTWWMITKAQKDEYVETILGRAATTTRYQQPKIWTCGASPSGNAINAPNPRIGCDLSSRQIHVHEWMKRRSENKKMILQVHENCVFDWLKDEV